MKNKFILKAPNGDYAIVELPKNSGAWFWHVRYSDGSGYKNGSGFTKIGAMREARAYLYYQIYGIGENKPEFDKCKWLPES